MSKAVQFVVEVLRGERATVRTMTSTDLLPSSFDVGFDQLGQIDYEWVWVVERQGTIRGALVASPCHGVALIWRLYLEKGEPISSLTKLLRVFLKDIRRRHLKGYITWVDASNKMQGKLKKIIEMANGKSSGVVYELMAAPLAKENI